MTNDIKLTHIKDLVELKTESFNDSRGLFLSAYKKQQKIFKDSWGSRNISQVNISKTYSVGVVRGLHYQFGKYSEAKLVRCIKGKLFDVAVDLRKSSETFGCFYSTILSAKKENALFIPEGFAHGFQILSPNSELLYIHSNIWEKESEKGIRFDDPTIAINWPLVPKGISDRDISFPYLKNSF